MLRRGCCFIINIGELVESTNVMRWLLKREPMGWEGWVKGKMEGLGKQ